MLRGRERQCLRCCLALSPTTELWVVSQRKQEITSQLAILTEFNHKTLQLSVAELEGPVFTKEQTETQKRKGAC